MIFNAMLIFKWPEDIFYKLGTEVTKPEKEGLGSNVNKALMKLTTLEYSDLILECSMRIVYNVFQVAGSGRVRGFPRLHSSPIPS